MDFGVIASKMGIFIVLLLIGYGCARLKITDAHFNKVCSKLVVNVFLIATILASVVNKEVTMSGKDLIWGTVLMFLLFVLNMLIGYFTPNVLRIKDGDIQMYRFLVTFMNNGFIALPVINSLYGDGAMFYASVSFIPINLFLYTFGTSLLQQSGEKERISLKKLLNPPIIAAVAAALIFVTKLRFPSVVEETIDTMAAATMPLSMMVVGSSLGAIPVGDAFTDLRLYKLNLFRLIIAPVLTWLIFSPFMHDRVMLGTLVLLSAAPSGIIATPLGIEYGRDGVESSKGIFLSTVLSMVTMPLIIILLGL